jgi:hypothetical protein
MLRDKTKKKKSIKKGFKTKKIAIKIAGTKSDI